MDNYDRFVEFDAEMERRLEQLPVCDCCGEPIQDEYRWEIGNEVYCERCANDLFRVSND